MKVEITPLDQLPRGRGVRVTIGEHRIAMFRIENDVYAIGDRCSHAEASLSEGEVWDNTVECPRHGSEFDLKTGEALSLPATQPVPVYPVSIEDGMVYLELEGV
ncbi:MAG TPA: non-heme iron oxygenase ferredoxin subunit [Acidimicrobiia bacterium]|nr:non-heme iron oxygenase ferredoxin subunit [Acidimicrobiia bacterium]